jgi:hypothetical protein
MYVCVYIYIYTHIYTYIHSRGKTYEPQSRFIEKTDKIDKLAMLTKKRWQKTQITKMRKEWGHFYWLYRVKRNYKKILNNYISTD